MLFHQWSTQYSEINENFDLLHRFCKQADSINFSLLIDIIICVICSLTKAQWRSMEILSSALADFWILPLELGIKMTVRKKSTSDNKNNRSHCYILFWSVNDWLVNTGLNIDLMMFLIVLWIVLMDICYAENRDKNEINIILLKLGDTECKRAIHLHFLILVLKKCSERS